MAVREAEPVGSLQEMKEAGLDREDLLGIYRNMLITRGIEERGHILYKQGKIPGSFYTGRGNEGAAVGVATAMGPNDVGAPLHRDMGVHVTRGVEPWRVFAQYMGREEARREGVTATCTWRRRARLACAGLPPPRDASGRDGHGARLQDPRRPQGRARLVRRRRPPARGDAHEAMNLAGVRQLPDRSSSATTTSGRTRRRRTSRIRSSTSPTARPRTGSKVWSSTEPMCSPSTARPSARSRRRARAAGRRCSSASPSAWRATPYTTTRSTSRRRCSRSGRRTTRSSATARWLHDHAGMTDDEEGEITSTVKRLLNDALDRAEESPLPDPSTLEGSVFASPEDLDTPHHK